MNDNANLSTTFSNYAVESVLASNDFSHRYTYLCKDLAGKLVILKEFRFGENKSWSPYLLVEKEIETLQKLDHPRIPKYIDKIETKSSVCFIQEYIEGKPLSPTWTEAAAAKMLLDVLDIIIYLQQNKIIHGDIKPDNILHQGDRYYLVDFGLTKVLKEEKSSTTIGGTTEFMPPEVMMGRGMNYTSDVYSLARTVLKLVSPKTEVELDLSVNLSSFSLLKNWLRQALQPKPEKRYPNAFSARQALQKCLTDCAIPTTDTDIDIDAVFLIIATGAGCLCLKLVPTAIFMFLETSPNAPPAGYDMALKRIKVSVDSAFNSLCLLLVINAIVRGIRAWRNS